MTRHEEVQRLKELMAAPVDHTGCRAGNILRETLLAMPWLLAVAGQFQPGDGDELDYAIQELNRIFGPDNVKETTDCLRRMAEAAAIMEAEQ